MTASKGLRPALLFLSSGASLTTASISARKLSKGTTALSVSSGSPLALIASRRLSRSKKPGCPTAFPRAADARTRESDLRAAGQSYFSRYPNGHHRLRCASPLLALARSANGILRWSTGTARFGPLNFETHAGGEFFTGDSVQNRNRWSL